MKVEVIEPPPVKKKVILELTEEEATIIRWSLEYYAAPETDPATAAAARAANKLKQFDSATYPYSGAFV